MVFTTSSDLRTARFAPTFFEMPKRYSRASDSLELSRKLISLLTTFMTNRFPPYSLASSCALFIRRSQVFCCVTQTSIFIVPPEVFFPQYIYHIHHTFNYSKSLFPNCEFCVNTAAVCSTAPEISSTGTGTEKPCLDVPVRISYYRQTRQPS